MSAISGVTDKSAGDLRADFLNLMVAQMRNQNPLDPMDNSQMTTQLAQLSQLEQLENLNSQFAQALGTQQLSQASGLLGKQITFLDANNQAVAARVESVALEGGSVFVRAGQYAVGLDAILSVSN